MSFMEQNYLTINRSCSLVDWLTTIFFVSAIGENISQTNQALFWYVLEARYALQCMIQLSMFRTKHHIHTYKHEKLQTYSLDSMSLLRACWAIISDITIFLITFATPPTRVVIMDGKTNFVIDCPVQFDMTRMAKSVIFANQPMDFKLLANSSIYMLILKSNILGSIDWNMRWHGVIWLEDLINWQLDNQAH